jgi:hypothetical protein
LHELIWSFEMFRNCLLAVSAIISVVFCAPLAAAENPAGSLPSEAFVQEVLAWLSGNFDLPSIRVAPVIAFASKEQLSALRKDGGLASADVRSEPALPGEAAHDRVVAVYDRSSETILLPLGWTGSTSAEQSILVHELVHHLQKVTQTRFECPMAAEKLAYLAQDRWLERSGSSLEKEFELDKFTILISTACFY